MGIIKENIQDAFEGYIESRKERFKWAPLLILFMLLTFLAGFVKYIFTKGADPLGGKETVEKYFTGNLARVIVMALIAAAFLLIVIKTWKGKASSVEQLIFTVSTGVFIVIMFVVSLKPVLSISRELKSPRTANVSSYTLCTDISGSKYYAAFDDSGNGAILLQIPKDKYDELSGGKDSDKRSAGEANMLVKEANYTNVQYYESAIEVTYYDKSIIYKSLKFKLI